MNDGLNFWRGLVWALAISALMAILALGLLSALRGVKGVLP